MTETLDKTTEAESYARAEVLVDTAWVHQHRQAPNVRLVEVDVDTSAFAGGHIPGAVGWDWRKDLQRHPVRDIPTREEWEALLSRSGIRKDSTIVLYGDNHNWFAAFAYWLFKLYGHEDVRLLNGGRQRWVDEGHPLASEVITYRSTPYTASEPNDALRGTRDAVARTLGEQESGLVDARSPGEFSGALLAPENLPQEGA